MAELLVSHLRGVGEVYAAFVATAVFRAIGALRSQVEPVFLTARQADGRNGHEHRVLSKPEEVAAGFGHGDVCRARSHAGSTVAFRNSLANVIARIERIEVGTCLNIEEYSGQTGRNPLR